MNRCKCRSDLGVPFVAFNLEARRAWWNDETSDSRLVAVLAVRAGENEAMCSFVSSSVPRFSAVDRPTFDTVSGFGHGLCAHVSRVGAMLCFCETKGYSGFSSQAAADQFALLLLVAKVVDHDHVRKVAHDRVLVLKVVEEAESFGGEVLANHSHPQIGAATGAVLAGLAAILVGEMEAVEASLVGAADAFVQ